MAAKKKTKTVEKNPLDRYTDEELEDFIRKRRIQNITPNLDSQIALMIEIISKAEKLEEYPFRDESMGKNFLERNFINSCKDYYSRLLRDKQSLENRAR